MVNVSPVLYNNRGLYSAFSVWRIPKMRTVHPQAGIKIFIGNVCKLLAYRDTEREASPFMIDYIKRSFVCLILSHFWFQETAHLICPLWQQCIHNVLSERFHFRTRIYKLLSILTDATWGEKRVCRSWLIILWKLKQG